MFQDAICFHYQGNAERLRPRRAVLEQDTVSVASAPISRVTLSLGPASSGGLHPARGRRIGAAQEHVRPSEAVPQRPQQAHRRNPAAGSSLNPFVSHTGRRQKWWCCLGRVDPIGKRKHDARAPDHVCCDETQLVHACVGFSVGGVIEILRKYFSARVLLETIFLCTRSVVNNVFCCKQRRSGGCRAACH